MNQKYNPEKKRTKHVTSPHLALRLCCQPPRATASHKTVLESTNQDTFNQLRVKSITMRKLSSYLYLSTNQPLPHGLTTKSKSKLKPKASNLNRVRKHPNDCTYNTLVMGLCKAQYMNEALELFQVMVTKGMKMEGPTCISCESFM
jgi:pentatricopeptide repeat protein